VERELSLLETGMRIQQRSRSETAGCAAEVRRSKIKVGKSRNFEGRIGLLGCRLTLWRCVVIRMLRFSRGGGLGCLRDDRTGDRGGTGSRTLLQFRDSFFQRIDSGQEFLNQLLGGWIRRLSTCVMG
jgi:hypothetical protein